MRCGSQGDRPGGAREPVRPLWGCLEVGEGDGEVAEKCGDRRSEGEEGGDDSGDGRASEAASDEEGGVPIQLPNPRTPTRQEREEHEATHLPYRSWCEHCVRGKGRRRGHRRRGSEQKKADLGNVTKVYMDFYYNGSSADKDEEKEDKEKDGGIDSPAVVLYDGRAEALATAEAVAGMLRPFPGSKALVVALFFVDDASALAACLCGSFRPLR